MKIAVQNPMFCNNVKGIHDWVVNFLKLYKPLIYLSSPAFAPFLFKFFRYHNLNPFDYSFTFSVRTLNACADTLINFGGRPYLKRNEPPKKFGGLKFFHVMDYGFSPTESYRALQRTGVDYLLGYARHDRYCSFFQEYYHEYIGRVIPVPFGFSSRFISSARFEQRKNRCVALGSVNSFDDTVHNRPDCAEINRYFLSRGEKFAHKFRRLLVEQENRLFDIMDSKLPYYPQVKDFGYDMVGTFNQYKMFVSCESILFFPPAKTFEGPAAGSVLVCSTHQCYSEYGFKDGVNCIKHKEFDIVDFREKVSYYLEHQDALAEIQKNGTVFVCENYTHQAVARSLYANLSHIFQEKSFSPR